MTKAGRAARIVAALVPCMALSVPAAAQDAPPLAQLRFDIIGVSLVVDPPALTVPKQIATQINTSLVIPAGAGADTRDAIAALTHGGLVEATLRGPFIPPTRITARPGEPLPLPPFALPGDYFLDGIRLVKDGATLLDATAPDGRPATTIPITVINEILVTGVTSRPLSLDEIKEKGIVIDEHNFQAVNFQVAFNIDGQPFTIQVPAALPTRELLNSQPNRQLLIRQLSVVNQQLAATQTLPPEFDRPGLNFSIAPLPFFFVPEEGEEPGFDIPPVTGLVVIPGNIAFLNQMFSVLLMVTNAAPDGTPLVLRDVKGTVRLPSGLDRVAGTFEQPGDDPLRLARIAGVGQVATVQVAQAGTDGERGTADDVAFLRAQASGEGEFLVEGLKEGSHVFDIEIDAVLDGLPSGPVNLSGQAAGAVFVRNPTFAVTIAHPRIVRSGEPYDVYATVTNTSLSPANLVSVNLDPLAVSGAQLTSDPTVSFETIGPGQAATARFRLIAQQTGEVTASSFTGEADGGIRLVTGVGERDVPLAPNAIVLPKTADALPASLVAAAQRVLGQAFSIATAPAEALPPGVLFITRKTVVDRGLELAEAGQRRQFGEALPRVAHDLALDWLGARASDDGFDQLMRTTDAGRNFLAEIAALLAPAYAADAFGTQQGFAEQALARAAPLTAVAGGPAGGEPVQLRVVREDGSEVGDSASTLPRAGLFQMSDSSRSRSLAAVVAPELTQYTIEATSPGGGAIDVGVTTPADSAQSRHLRFAGVALDPGGTVRVVVDLSAPGQAAAQVDRNGDGVFDETVAGTVDTIVEETLEVVEVRQIESSFFAAAGDVRDPATYGLLVAVLFNKPTTEASVEDPAHYAIEGNAVAGAAQQAGGRLVYLYLERPVGGLVPRALTVRGALDLHGGSVGEHTRPIAMVLTDGARVFGQVREADGIPVPNAFLSLVVAAGNGFAFTVAAIKTDGQGSFDFDFVPRLGSLGLTAQHPGTRALAGAQARIRGAGESLLLNPTFLGAGTVRGRVVAADGATPVPNATVALFPGSVFTSRGFQTTANGLGEFTFNSVPVGVFTLRAIDGRSASGQSTGVLHSAGAAVVADIVVVDEPDDGGTLVGRVFLSDGVTPAAGFTVLVGQYSRDDATIQAIDQAQSDGTGSFTFARSIRAGTYDVVAVDQSTGQLGATKVTIVALTTNAVSVVMEAAGAVEGVVFNASGQPVAGAMVAGGVALAQTDANGFFRIEGVPAGSRKIEAGDPATRRRGAATVNVLPGQTVTAAITLEARATFTGRVLDASGNPVPRASVRIPQVGGFTFVIANNQGVFTFPDMPLGDYLIQAPGPTAEALAEFMQANGTSPDAAFTSGDGPGAPSTPSSGNFNSVVAAYQNAVRQFLTVDESLLGLPDADLGGFGWNKVRLQQDSVTQVADIRFLPKGAVSGRTLDADGRPAGALVRVSALKVSRSGFAAFGELARTTSDAATGEFSFDGIARFDVATFQTAGVRGGDYTLEAAHQFSPSIVTFRDQLNTANPNRANVVLQFPAAADTNGTVSGLVLMPDGVTPAPAGTQVRISFGDLTVTTGADGRFSSPLPIPAGGYTFVAQTPTSGLRGQAMGRVPAGGNLDLTIRLLGVSALTVHVRRPDGQAVANAIVRVQRGTFPQDRADGVTDPAGMRRFVNLTEGPFSVDVEETLTGLRGRASGVLVRDGEATATVTITASGRVTGTFVTAADNRPIPFAQVTLSGSGVQAYATTDATGRFEVTAIPVGPVAVEASDPATGRIGRAQSQLSFEGQAIDITVVQLPRGTVAGFVLNADNVTGVPGATVHLETSSFVPTRLQVSTRADGSFRADGIPAGAFRLEARDPASGGTGVATGSLTFEGETVDRNIVLEPFAAIRVTVHDEAGSPAANVRLTASQGTVSREAAADVNGQFTFENLRLGRYTLTGVSLADPLNGGAAIAELDEPNETIDALLTLRGVAPVTVRVVAADGVSPVASSRVTMTAKGAFEHEPAGPTAATLVGFTGGDGQVSFPSVPVGAYFAKGESGALAGVAAGVTPGFGQPSAVTVTLGASGSIAGRVVLPGGVIPAARALVTLDFQSQSGLQSGVLQVTTDLSGRFEFGGIPLGAFTISAFEVVSNGVRTRAGTLTAGGQTLDMGDLELDNAGPRVLSVTPGDRSGAVPPDTAVAVVFSEPMNPATLSAATLALMDGSTVVPGVLASSSDRRTFTFTPSQPLRSSGFYVLTVKGSPDGPRDESNLALVDPFVSTFTVRDVVAPAIVSTSPAPAARQVPPEAVVRVAFSEAVSMATLVLRNPAGQVVPGQTAFAVGGTVVTLAPLDFLLPNHSYSATVSGVADLAGNPLAGGPLTFAFNTIDTLAPLVTALGVQGAARSGNSITISPVIAGEDVQRVEYAIGADSRVATAAPFSTTVVVPGGVTTFSIAARAIDHVGNRSEAFVLPIPVEENLPPTVQLLNLSGNAIVAQGASVSFDVAVADDAGVAQVLLSAVGAVTQRFTQNVAGSPTSATARFTVTVPVDAAAGGGVTIQAAAIDNAGNRSTPATLELSIRDGVAPAVVVSLADPALRVIPGESFAVTVEATDAGGVTSVVLTCNPALIGCETRPIAPAATTTTQTFVVQVPVSLNAPANIALLAAATDASGNIGQAGRVVPVADVVPPALTGVQLVSGSTRVLAGATFGVTAGATDGVGVAAFEFTVDGAVTATGTVNVTPAAATATAQFEVVVPAAAPNGGVITVHARARDAAGNASGELTLVVAIGDTAPPTIAMSAPPENDIVTPGQTVTVQASATDDVGVAQVVFSARGVVTFDETRTFNPAVTPAQATFLVPTAIDTPAGTVTLSARALDAAGNESAEVSRTVTIRDATAPGVSVVSPGGGVEIDPRVPLDVSVAATDAVGVAEVGLTLTGALIRSEVRAVAPPETSRTESFVVAFAQALPEGGALTLTGTARDAAGNQALSTAVTVVVRDVVAPSVTSVTPSGGATNVDVAAPVVIQFSEPMDRASVIGAVRLAAGTTPVTATISIAADDRSATLTPQSALEINTQYTVTIDATARDRAANALATTVTSTFRTTSPDATAPKVQSIDPPDGAVGVGTTVPVVVVFTEAVDPATVSPTSFRVSVGGVPVAGTFGFLNGGTTVAFTPSAELPFDATVVIELTGDIADLAGNGLVNGDDSAITTPITSTYLTGSFAIVSPGGTTVLEKRHVPIEARAASSLTVASVVFTVNGVALPAVTTPFVRVVTTPAAATSPVLTVVASARNASGAEIARAERTYQVLHALGVTPAVMGLPRGGTGVVRFSIEEALPEDLAIGVSASNASVSIAGDGDMVLPAGATTLEVSVVACATCPSDPASRIGAAVGNAAVVATSARGTAVAVVSVSDPVSGQMLTPLSSGVGLAIALPPSAGQVLAGAGRQVRSVVSLLSAPAPADVPVSITSSNPAVATGTVSAVLAGQQVATLDIITGVEGTAVLTLRAGDTVRSVTVIVGTPAPNQTPISLAPATGVAIASPPSAGQIVTASGRNPSVMVTLLSAPAAAEIPVSVTSSNPLVASATAAAIQPGEHVTALDIVTGVDGTAVLTLRAGETVRSLMVIVGTPPANQTPLSLAAATGVSIASPPFIGQAFAPLGTPLTLGLVLLPAPAATTTSVTITSSNPTIVEVVSPNVSIPAGSRVALIEIATGAGGRATLTLEFEGGRRDFDVVVGGPPTPTTTAVASASGVGVSVVPSPGLARIVAPAGGPVTATVGVQLLRTPRASDVTVTVTSSHPGVVSVGSGTTTTLTIPAGALVVPVGIATLGSEGTALLTFEIEGQRFEVLVVVGNPPPSQLPAVTAPAIGLQVQP